jgi:5-methylcytosine-specific restriction endonuclease McrA
MAEILAADCAFCGNPFTSPHPQQRTYSFDCAREYEKTESRARNRRLRAQNPERTRVLQAAKTARRYARRRGAGGSHTAEEWAALCQAYGNMCLRCGATGRPLTRDHVVPLVLGGTNTIDNLQPLCFGCNSAKGGRKTIDYREGVPMQNNSGKKQRLSVSEAASALGITVDAVRSRVKRGTIAYERVGGRVYVLLGTDEARPGQPPSSDQPSDRTDLLIATLREQVEAEREANRENRRIIAALTSRIPEIEAPERPPEAPVTATDKPERDTSARSEEGAQEGAQRPWWRRWLGG